jgi:DNA repair protein RadD
MTTAAAPHPAIALRPYQAEAVAAVYDHLRSRDDNPCVVCPTGAGKGVIIAQIARDVTQLWDGRILILAHVKELLEQAVDKLRAMAPDLYCQIGVYSAGLKSRDTDQPIIVAGIQSVYRRACDLGRFDLILIDEVHMLPPDGEGMYRQFLKEAQVVNPHLRLVGLTATPYRMTTGTICAPENLLNHVCYEVGVRELIVQGYLCPLKTKAGRHKVDTSSLHVRGGEFVAGEVEALMDDDALVGSACHEIIEHTRERHSVLIFAAGVKHAQHVQRILESLGHECGFVCGDTLPFDRAATLDRFKAGGLKYLVNVNVLTTGFDAPNIDCVALLRPTNSPGLYYQMVGRGFRLHPSKTDCLVLDFGGNILRHGPVDALQIKDRSSGGGEAPAKECPQCQAVIHAAYSVCPECGHVFPPPQREKHEATAHAGGILSGEVTQTEYEVRDVYYSAHAKRDAPVGHPRTLRVDYRLPGVGFNDYRSEWVCVEHPSGSFARQKAEAWWRMRSHEPCPESAQDAVDLADRGALAETKTITVRSVTGERFDRIINYQLGPVPPRLDGSDERDDGNVARDPLMDIPDAEIPF